MFCSNCGTQIQDGEKFCPNCGTPVADNAVNAGAADNTVNTGAADNTANNGDQSVNASDDVIKGFSAENAQNTNTGFEGNVAGAGAGYTYTGPTNFMPLKTDRSLLLYIILSIVTCGIYSLVFIYQLIQDVNVACEGDGDDTPGFLMFFLLSIVTCGIYGYVWYYKLGNRLQVNCARYGAPTTEGGSAVLLWMLFGQLLCGIGPFIAWNILIINTNTVCQGYNRAHGMM